MVSFYNCSWCCHGDDTGWESQLLETGFLAIFLSPVISLRQLPRHSPTHPVIVWGYRWLIFRIMMGAVSVSVYEQGEEAKTQLVPPIQLSKRDKPKMQLAHGQFFELHCVIL